MFDSVLSRIKRKSTFVIDACRNQLDQQTVLETVEEARLLQEGRDRTAELRAVFDDCVAKATTDKAIMYGCRRNEDAVGMSKSGGVFTTFLLNQAKKWALSKRGAAARIYTCLDAINGASNGITAAGYEQVPKLDARSKFGDLPFAVWLPT